MNTRSHLILAPILVVTITVALSACLRSNEASDGTAPRPIATAEAAQRASGDDDSGAGEVHLLEYAGNSAVFRAGAELRRVRIGERVPGAGAVLRHINSDGVLVEFVGDSAQAASMLLIQHGHAVYRPAGERLATPARPQLLIASAHMSRVPDSAKSNVPPSHGTEP